MPIKTIRQKVDTIYQTRKDLLSDLEAIRETCEHKETEVLAYGDHRHSNPANICKECDHKVSWVEDQHKVSQKITFSRVED